MDAYTLHLLGMAVDDLGGRGYRIAVSAIGVAPVARDEWVVSAYANDPNRPSVGKGPTLADALAALLADLGAEVPERPTAERRDEVWQHLNEAEHNGEFLDGMRDYPDRLAVLALLEEGS